MMNQKKIMITTLMTILLMLIVISINVIVRKHEASIDYTKKIILFYSDTCPHCAKVENFLQTNHVMQKIDYEIKEVTNNRDNFYNLVDLAQRCQLDNEKIAVPFLWTGKTCITGDKPIIKFFQEKLREKK